MKIKLYRSGRRFINVYLAFIIICFAIIFALFVSASDSLEASIKSETKEDLKSFSNVFSNEIAQLSTDIFLISDLLSVHDSLIINGTSTEFDSEANREIIETEFIVWLGMKQSYDQIRILDNSGHEVARANFNSGNPSIVEYDDLQDKSMKDYFTESIILNDRDLYMSVLDLNKENGEIEILEDGNSKPMLRVATPLFNKDGVKLGVVIVNFLADNIFQALDNSGQSSIRIFEIINESGYYLYANDKSIEFAFMFDNLEFGQFSDYHNYDILSKTKPTVTGENFEDEYYTSIRISSVELTSTINNLGNEDINVVFGDKEFIIFTELDLSENQDHKNLLLLYTTISIATILVGLVITRLIDESVHLQQENLMRIKYDSIHDLLTGLPNRKNIYEHIQNQLNRNKEFALLFIDFDKFKNVNDKFGHDMGDEALIQGSKRINDCIRFDDVLARVGGDEFIVLLKDLNSMEVVSRICTNIVSSFKEKFELKENEASMGVSIGAYLASSKDDNLENIINKSDKAMYKVKNSGKNNFHIFNENDKQIQSK